jgi:hypothetical protein
LRWERDGFSVEAAKKKRRPLPDDHWFHDRPAPVVGQDFFFAAYRDLQTCRTPDGPIPWTAAMAYADRKGLDPDAAEAIWVVVRKLDGTERQWRYEQLKAETGG